MVYGFATAYLLTGEDRYLRRPRRAPSTCASTCGRSTQKSGRRLLVPRGGHPGRPQAQVLASEFGDDYDAIPAYEQIYALAGPTQTYRVTGDPRILRDTEMTVNLFDRYFLDKDREGYFSHLDPVTMDPRDESLAHNRARKNWNSVGDHAPAYLINLWLATGDRRYADMLASLRQHDRHPLPRLRAQPVRQREILRGLDPGPRDALAEEPGRRRPQSEDRLEPDARTASASGRAVRAARAEDRRA